MEGWGGGADGEARMAGHQAAGMDGAWGGHDDGAATSGEEDAIALAMAIIEQATGGGGLGGGGLV